jgi:uncharacterized protein
MTRSALYRGWISHRRLEPVEHSFRYRVQMALLDLDELPEAFDRHPLWSARRAAPVRFRRSDYLGDPRNPLADSARALVAERVGHRPAGPVRLLTTPRFLGLGFNPVSFYFLHGRDGNSLEAVIAEVTNTPWGERHSYVLDGRGQAGALEGSFGKTLHVSPFMPMEQTYSWRVGEPGDRLGVSISSEQEGRTVFEASLALERHPLTRAEMTRALVTHPPAAATTLTRIYWNALKLKLKGAPYHPRPAAG